MTEPTAASGEAGSRESFSSALGFTLAAVGSAVGLGNMWRFSYQAAENGGAAFVFLYIAMTALVGLPVMLAELTVGRGARRSPIQALVHFGGRGWGPLGLVFVVAGVVILGYYSVIAGWTVRYAIEIAAKGFAPDSGAYFQTVAFVPQSLAWHVGFMGLTAMIVSGGIRGGIERASIVLMPVLAVLVVGLAIYAATLDGAGEGYAYYFGTDELAAMGRLEVITSAAGQAFFSLSLGMGAILTYASYLDDHHDLPRESVLIAVSDFAIAFIAGLVVFPFIFAFGLEEQVGESTVGALFITLPEAFATLGALGRFLGTLFFVALVVGALTSAISLLEVVVASVIDNLGWSRPGAVWSAAGVITLVGVPAAFSERALGIMDKIGGELVLVFGGLLLAVFVGYRMRDPVGEMSRGSREMGWFFAWRALLRYVVPPVLVFVLWFSLQATLDLLLG
jgi:NSS family neurotransmitter:Na+ symporter